jgi:hypothetical protein
MMKFFLVRNLYAQDGGEIWHSSPVADELEVYLKICQENWVGNFEILPEFELEAQRDKIQAKDYVTYFR